MNQIHVVIPVYNAKPYLREAVNSVLNQPYKGIDIILVDDGSTDGSGALCDMLAAENSRISVIHQENSGVSAARNAGIEAVLEITPPNRYVSHYVAFLDADDVWYDNAFSENFPVISQKYDPEDLLGFSCILADHSLKRFSLAIIHPTYRSSEGSRSIWKCSNHFCAYLYPVSILREYGIRFISNLSYSEDKIFLTQSVFLSQKVHFHPTLLHIYRGRPGSAVDRITRIPPIDYYTPIIDAWVKSDDFLNHLEPRTGRTIHAGHVLAGIYLLDMAADHLAQGRSLREIINYLCAHPHFPLLQNMRPQDVSEEQYQNSRMLLETPVRFQIKCLFRGIPHRFRALLHRLPFFYKFKSYLKYPLTTLPPQSNYSE